MEKIFFPDVCPVCGRVIFPHEKICIECMGKIETIGEPKCEKCGKKLQNDEKLFCTDCDEVNHVFDRGICIFNYKEEMKEVLYRFKYKNKRCYSDFFGYVGAKKYRKLFRQWKVKMIVPVPMYQKKQQRRGYNQAEEFARSLTEYTDIPMATDLIKRLRETKPQKGLNKEERYKNLKNAFGVNPEKAKGVNSVLLVDDIYTTGSTIDACAKVLKVAGVEKVYFMCVAGGRDRT